MTPDRGQTGTRPTTYQPDACVALDAGTFDYQEEM
jgi:hypothetical protein